VVKETNTTGELSFLAFGVCDRGGKINLHTWLLPLTSLAEKTGGGGEGMKKKMSDPDHLVID